jgi:hypothetical protein
MLIPPGGECVALSAVYYRYPSDKTIFVDSHVVRLLTASVNDDPDPKAIVADLRRAGIRVTISQAILLHKRLPHQDLPAEQVEFDRILGLNPIPTENFFDRRKMYFTIRQPKSRAARA